VYFGLVQIALQYFESSTADVAVLVEAVVVVVVVVVVAAYKHHFWSIDHLPYH